MLLENFQLNCFKWNEKDRVLTIMVKGWFRLGTRHIGRKMDFIFRSV